MAWVGDSRAVVLTKRPQHSAWAPFQDSAAPGPRLRAGPSAQEAAPYGVRLASLAETGQGPSRQPRDRGGARGGLLTSSQGAAARTNDWDARLRGFSGALRLPDARPQGAVQFLVLCSTLALL